MTVENAGLDLAAFAALLEACGGAPQRWPADRRAAAEQLLAASVEARRLLAEAQALDLVLDRPAGLAHWAPPDLAARIVASALAVRPAVAAAIAASSPSAGNVVALPRRLPRPQPMAPPRVQPPSLWRIAAMLGAVLMTGVLVGALDVLPQPIGGLVDLAGVTSESEPVIAALQIDDLTGGVDEEHL